MKRRPKTVAELVEIMKKNDIRGSVPDSDKYPNKPVVITDYNEGGPLYIWLPSQAALKRELEKVVPNKSYPLPSWYSVAFGGAPRVDLAEGEGKAFAARRVGEYVIQECC